MSDRSTKTSIETVTSSINSSTSILSNGATYTGTAELNKMPDVMVSCKTDKDGVLYFDFSNDGTNWDTFPTNGFTVTANVHEFHTAVKGGRYFRVRLTNDSGADQTYLRLYTYYGSFRQGNLPLNQSVSSDADSTIVRSVNLGETDGGIYKNVPVTQEGHLEIAVHDPRLPFGSIHVENLTPVFQSDAVYGLNAGQVTSYSSGSGSVSASDSNFVASTGTTIYSQGVILGRKRLRYRAGQGIVGRFAGYFTTPVANSYQLIGFGHAEDGVYFGYGDTNDLSNTEFGILYVNRGVREVRTLTVTVGSSTAENVTVRLNGTNYSVAVTNSGNIQRTVYEISQGTYAGWDAYPSGATVVFVRKSSGTASSGTYTLTASTAVGTFAQTKAGVASTDLFIPQSEWNGDKLDGTGASGVTIDPTKGNVYQIGIQYLGYGAITFKVEVTSTDSNNPDFVTVHTLKLPNTLTTTSFGNPSFPFTMAAYSAGSTTNLTVKAGSFAGFIEGQKMLQGNRFTYFNQLTTVGAANIQALFSIQNARYYQGRTNQAVINLLSASGAIKHTSPVVYYLIRNGTLAGNPNFQSLSTNSCSLWDTAATTVTYSTGDQLLWTGHIGDTGEIDHHFGNGSYNAEEITLQPGDIITLGVKATTGTPSYVTGSINTREDQ